MVEVTNCTVPSPYASKHILQYQEEKVKHTIIKMSTLLQVASKHNQNAVIPEVAFCIQLLLLLALSALCFDTIIF